MHDTSLERVERIMGMSNRSANPVLFDMRLDPQLEVFLSFAWELLNHKMVKLPYEQCAFEWDAKFEGGIKKRMSIYAWDSGDGIINAILFSNTHGEPIIGYEFDYINDTMATCSFGDELINETIRDHDEAFLHSTAKYISSCLLGFIASLSTRGVQETVEITPKKQNEKRLSRGARALPERHTVYISVGASDGTTGEIERAGPRPHWRRGHIRRLSSGRLVSVSPCVVAGSAAQIKGYVVN